MARSFPSEIPFWISVVGVPTEFWSAQTFQSIGDAIRETKDVDLYHGKIRVVLDGFKELCFETTVDFTRGEGSLPAEYQESSGKKEPEEDTVRRGDDRSRSYKGVVIRGVVNHQDNTKERRGYHGKGKGKIYEEQDAKRSKNHERDNKRPYSNRGSNRYEEGSSRHRSSRWEQSRNQPQEARHRTYRKSRHEQNPPGKVLDEIKEDCEIQNTEGAQRVLQQETSPPVAVIAPVLQQEQSTIINTSVEVIAKPTSLDNGQGTVLVVANKENGFELAKDSIEFGKNDLDDDIMDFEELKINIDGNGDPSDEDFQNLTDEEKEELDSLQEDLGEINEGAVQTGELGAQEPLEAIEEKKKGTRKALFKQQALVVITSKKMFVQAVLSPRKKGTR
ncbi:hypothetical protein Bca4012_064353 [Brassica carinata]